MTNQKKNKFSNYFDRVYDLFLSNKSRSVFEKIILWAAIVIFIIQLGAILLTPASILSKDFYSHCGTTPNPLSSVYTPFSVILLYEIYLLIFYLSKSITIYLGRQYEVIALILIRRTFEDLSLLSDLPDGYTIDTIVSLLWTFGGLIILFLLIFCFYKLAGTRKQINIDDCDEKRRRFIVTKKILALILLVLFGVLFVASFSELKNFRTVAITDIVYAVKSMSNVFFNTFFTGLILTEVLLLLFTFNLSGSFSKIIRNSGFIISTILLKLSFRADGQISMAFILMAVSFSVIILGITRLFDKRLSPETMN
ncbi:MAG: hypothetical protein FWG22_01060 [Prolixibacteraceae bacterium]|nr:hypothetical protein [Prolixibacteraceae bacterium]